jgi:ribonuclease HI
VDKAAKRYVKQHRTTIHEALHTFKIDPKSMEKISAVLRSLKWKPTHRMEIPKNKVEALERIGQIPDNVQIFTDGSCIDGKVGTAAVLYKGGVKQTTTRKYLGSATENTVVEAELVGAIMGTHMAATTDAESGATIAMDNQAALIASMDEKQRAGQYLINILQGELKRNKNKGEGACTILQWVPGKEGSTRRIQPR